MSAALINWNLRLLGLRRTGGRGAADCCCGGAGGLGLGASWLLVGRDDRVQNGAFHARHELDDASVADVLDQAVDDVVAEVAVGHLAATEAEARLHLVAAVRGI